MIKYRNRHTGLGCSHSSALAQISKHLGVPVFAPEKWEAGFDNSRVPLTNYLVSKVSPLSCGPGGLRHWVEEAPQEARGRWAGSPEEGSCPFSLCLDPYLQLFCQPGERTPLLQGRGIPNAGSKFGMSTIHMQVTFLKAKERGQEKRVPWDWNSGCLSTEKLGQCPSRRDSSLFSFSAKSKQKRKN